jgi:SPP1 gp7 family putative phage head morphogenesis protein
MRALTLDAQGTFAPAKSTEKQYERELKKVAKQVGHIIALYQRGAELLPGLDKALFNYSEALGPWATLVAERMLAAVGRTNYRQWKAKSKTLSRELREDSNVAVARDLTNENVALIKSLPIEAGTRAQTLAMEAVTGGKRADEVAKEIARSGEVTASRATLIARTEVAKANSAITQARAADVGATHYVWRTADDESVRESHAEMEGEVVAFDDPPELDGMVGHAGEFPNCRCYPEPIIA